MTEESLSRTIDRWAAFSEGLAASELDREWAWGAYDSEGVRFAFFRTYEELRELAARIATRRLEQGRPMTTAQRILAQYHIAYRDLQAALLGVPDAALEQPPEEGEWALRMIARHIAGAEVGFYGSVAFALGQHRSGAQTPVEMADEDWDRVLGSDDATHSAIVDGPYPGIRAYHQQTHDRVLAEFAGISEEELEVPSLYWEGYPLSLRFRLGRFDSHLRQHTVQMDKTLSAIGQEPNEAKRLLRLIYAALGEAEGATIGAWDAGEELATATASSIEEQRAEIAAVLGD